MNMRVQLALECPVCLRNRNEDDIAEAIVVNALFGVVDPYAVCPQCHREAKFTLRYDPEFRRRVRVWFYEERGIVLRKN